MADFLMADNIYRRIISNYNNAISVCKDDYFGDGTSTNEFICGFELALGEKISDRPQKRGRIPIDVDGRPYDEFYKIMCGCRISTLVMFTMLKLDIDKPIGPDFLREYKIIYESEMIQKIMGNPMGHNIRLYDDYAVGFGLDHKIPTILPENPDLYIVQILAIDEHIGIGTAHSFIVKVEESGLCHILSSWNDHERTTPPIHERFEFYELRAMLKSYTIVGEQINWSGIQRDACERLFGPGNVLGENLIVLFLNEDLLNPLHTGGNKKKVKTKSKNKKSKRKKKRKRKTKTKSK